MCLGGAAPLKPQPEPTARNQLLVLVFFFFFALQQSSIDSLKFFNILFPCQHFKSSEPQPSAAEDWPELFPLWLLGGTG